jgi:hypothetical protein
MIFWMFLFLFPFLCLIPQTVLAARPLSTDDTSTVEQGKFQMEVGMGGIRVDSENREFTSSAVLTFGLLDRLDLGAGTAYLLSDPKGGNQEGGITDTELKPKYRFLDERDWIPALAVSGSFFIPTATKSKGLGQGKLDFIIKAIATKNLSKRVALHFNFGSAFIKDQENEWIYSMAGQFIMTERWALVGEIVGVNNLNGHTGDDPLLGLLGTQYTIRGNLVWDLGVEAGLNKAAPDLRITTGLTWIFKP